MKFVASDYGARLGLSRKYSVRWQEIEVLLRSNRVDCRLMAEVFGGCYNCAVTGPIRTILDLGANIGLAAIYFHRIYPQADIACVEPSPANAALLEEIVNRNKLSIRLVHAAIGCTTPLVHFNEAEDPSCSGVSNDGAILVPQITVPDLMAELGWRSIDLLKIDIEGQERAVFRQNAEWLHRVRSIVGEIHQGYDFQDLRADLEPYGFSVEPCGAKSYYGQQTFSAQKLAA